MTSAPQAFSDPAGPPAAALSVVAVTRREVRVGLGARTLSCERVVLTPETPLPGRDSRADVVAVCYHPGLTADERAAITGPPEVARSAWPPVVLGVALLALVASTGAYAAGWVPVGGMLAVWLVVAIALPALGFRQLVGSTRRKWPEWSRAVLAAHQRVYPPDEYPAPSAEVSRPAGAMWGTAQDERARRCWQELVSVATIPRPVTGAHPAPAGNRGKHHDGSTWLTPTEVAGDQLGPGDYTTLTRRLVALAEDLRSGRVPELSTEHVLGWKEVFELSLRTGEARRSRVDWAPVLFP